MKYQFGNEHVKIYTLKKPNIDPQTEMTENEVCTVQSTVYTIKWNKLCGIYLKRKIQIVSSYFILWLLDARRARCIFFSTFVELSIPFAIICNANIDAFAKANTREHTRQTFPQTLTSRKWCAIISLVQNANCCVSDISVYPSTGMQPHRIEVSSTLKWNCTTIERN